MGAGRAPRGSERPTRLLRRKPLASLVKGPPTGTAAAGSLSWSWDLGPRNQRCVGDRMSAPGQGSCTGPGSTEPGDLCGSPLWPPPSAAGPQRHEFSQHTPPLQTSVYSWQGAEGQSCLLAHPGSPPCPGPILVRLGLPLPRASFSAQMPWPSSLPPQSWSGLLQIPTPA